MFYFKKYVDEKLRPRVCADHRLNYRGEVARIPMVLSGSNSLLLPDPEVLRCLLILALGMQMVEGSCVPVSSQQDTHKWLRYSCDSVMLKQILAQRQHKVGND